MRCVKCPLPAIHGTWPYDYIYDLPFHSQQMKAFKTREGFETWMERYCYGVEDWNGYLREVGFERLMKLHQMEEKFNPSVY